MNHSITCVIQIHFILFSLLSALLKYLKMNEIPLDQVFDFAVERGAKYTKEEEDGGLKMPQKPTNSMFNLAFFFLSLLNMYQHTLRINRKGMEGTRKSTTQCPFSQKR